MTRTILASVVLALTCTSVGLGVGYLAARPDAFTAGAAADEPHDHRLGPATLRNLGVTTGTVQKSTFQRTRPLAAVIVDGPLADRPVVAPAAGRVEAILVQPGQRAAAGTPLVRLMRDALPRPELVLTARILQPAPEDVHTAVGELRAAHAEAEIVRAELARLEPFAQAGEGELPLVPRQRIIDLRNQEVRAQAALARAREELEKHGLSESQADAVARGASLPPPGVDSWLRALEHNGLWTPAARALHEALPEGVRQLPWSVATVGELTAAGLAGDALAEWLRASPAAAGQFLAVGALLLQGHSLEHVRRQHELGALAPIVTVLAPDGDFDVRDLLVQPGAHVAAGQALLRLHDPGELFLRVEPVGSEVATLLHAVEKGLACRAEPLLAGTGPALADLRVGWVEGAAGGDGSAMIAVSNTPLGDAGAATRTWQLRAGLRYLLQVPDAALDDVFVLPAGALARDGARHVVFIHEGGEFAPVEVEVLYSDERVAVLASRPDGEPHPGDELVLTGAFALSIALQEGGGAAHHHHH